MITPDDETKTYTVHVPAPLDAEGAKILGVDWPIEDEAFVWCAVESFNTMAANDRPPLELINVRDLGELDPGDVDPKYDEVFGRPRSEFRWRVFEADARRPAWMTGAATKAIQTAGQLALEQAEEADA